MSTNKEILQNYNTRLEAIKTTLEQSCVELATPVLNVDESANKVRAEITQPAGIIKQPKKPFTYTINPTAPDAQFGFELNGNGYWESQNGVPENGEHSSAAVCRVNLDVNTPGDIAFKVINYAENSCDYAIFGKLDTALGIYYDSDDNGAVQQSFSGMQSEEEVDLVYTNVTTGSHFIDVKFRKDISVDAGNDSVQFRIVEPEISTIPFACSDWMDLPSSCEHTSVARANTTMSVSANDTSDTITVTASNNQGTGIVQGSNATASKTLTLTTSGKTATVSDGTYSISKDVTTATRASTTLSIPAGTSTSFTATAGNNQSTGYVTGSNKTATKTIYLRENGATVEAASATSGGTVYGVKNLTTATLNYPNSVSACTYAGNGTCAATGTNITLGSKTTSAPTSGAYIKVTGSGIVNMNPCTVYPDIEVSDGVYVTNPNFDIPAGSARSSNTATAYYPISKVTSSSLSWAASSLSTYGSQKTTPAVSSSSWPTRFVVHIVYKNNGANKVLYLMGTRPTTANSILYLTPPCADSAQLIWLQRDSSNKMTLTMPYNSTTFAVQNVYVYSWNLASMPS